MGHKFIGIWNGFLKKKNEKKEVESEEIANILPELKPKVLQDNMCYQRMKKADQLRKNIKFKKQKKKLFFWKMQYSYFPMMKIDQMCTM